MALLGEIGEGDLQKVFNDAGENIDARPKQPFNFCAGSPHLSSRRRGFAGTNGNHAAERVTAPAAPVRIQSRAARCAAAISSAVISAAISRRSRTASLLPCMAARLNHLCAVT